MSELQMFLVIPWYMVFCYIQAMYCIYAEVIGTLILCPKDKHLNVKLPSM